MRASSKGFSLVLVVIIVAAAGLAGLIVWRMLVANQPAENNSTSQDRVQEEKYSATDPNKGYAVISEWNVRFKPVEGVGEITQKTWQAQRMPVEAEVKAEGGIKITLSTQELAKLGEDCDVNKNEFGLWTLYRSAQPQDFNENVTLGKVGEFYYYYFGAQAACVISENDYTLNSNVSGLLRESLKTLELAK